MKNRETWIYLLIVAIAFYLCPLVINNTGIAMLVLLILFPAVCFVCSFLQGYKYSFTILFPILIGLLFFSTVYIYYNSSASIYVLLYTILSLIAMLLGKGVSMYDRKRKND